MTSKKTPDKAEELLHADKRYLCRICELTFLAEELGFRYSWSSRKCIRCIVDEHAADGQVSLPSCYGKEYNASIRACYDECTVREACIISLVDGSANDWSLSKNSLKSAKGRNSNYSKERGMSLFQVSLRMLKVAGRPMHINDMLPVAEKLMNGAYIFKSTDTWLSGLRAALYRNEDVVALGKNVYVWRGVWNPSDGGRNTWGSLGRKDPRVKDLDQVLAELPELPAVGTEHDYDPYLNREDQYKLRQLTRDGQDKHWRNEPGRQKKKRRGRGKGKKTLLREAEERKKQKAEDRAKKKREEEGSE